MAGYVVPSPDLRLSRSPHTRSVSTTKEFKEVTTVKAIPTPRGKLRFDVICRGLFFSEPIGVAARGRGEFRRSAGTNDLNSSRIRASGRFSSPRVGSKTPKGWRPWRVPSHGAVFFSAVLHQPNPKITHRAARGPKAANIGTSVMEVLYMLVSGLVHTCLHGLGSHHSGLNDLNGQVRIFVVQHRLDKCVAHHET